MKQWWKSKLVWFNVLVTVGTVAESSLHIIAANFTPDAYFGLVVGISAVNVILRFATNTGISK